MACFPRCWPGYGNCLPPPDLRAPEPRLPVLVHGPPAPTAERPANRGPGVGSGVSACPLPGILEHQDHLRTQGSAHHDIRGIGSDQFRTVQETTCIVIDQTANSELLRGPLVKKLLQLVTWLPNEALHLSSEDNIDLVLFK